MTARTMFLDALETIITNTPALENVRVIRSPRQVDDLGRTPIIQAKTDAYERTPASPRRNVTWTGTATLVSPHKDTNAAEEQLEQLFDALTTPLTSSQFLWTAAPLVAYGQNEDGSAKYLALDIAVTAIFQKE
jgi:hypothetical protein